MVERHAGLRALIGCAIFSACLSSCSPCPQCAETAPSSQSVPPTPRVESPPTPPANGIARDAQDLIPPGPPGSIRVERRDGSYALEWNGTRDDTIQGYQVYRRRVGGAWEVVTSVKLRADDEQNRGTYTYEERSNEVLEFTVAAVDARGKPGQKTCEIH